MSGKRDIRSLTGLRGVAALLVVIYHFSHDWRPAEHRTFVGPGYLAVDLFFLLSGFLMTMTYGHYFTGRVSRRAYGEFLWRRVARVYPVYFVVTLVAFGLTKLHIDHRYLHVESLVSDLFLLQNTGIGLIAPQLGESLVGVSWSLSTEAIAYILFPALTIIVGHTLMIGRQSLIALCGIFALCAIVVFDPHGTVGPLDLTQPNSLSPLIRCLADYLLGICTWRFVHAKVNHYGRSYLGLVASVIIVSLWFMPGSDVLIVPAFCLLIAACWKLQDPLSRLLSSRSAFFLGEASYSLYLIHRVSLSGRRYLEAGLLRAHIPHGFSISFAILGVLDLIVAYCMYVWLEKPAQQFLQQLVSKRRVPATIGEPSAP